MLALSGLAAALLAALPAPAAAGTETIGRSVEGTPIRAVVRGPQDAGRTVLVVGTVHGDEQGGLAVIRELRRRPLPEGLRLVILGQANPDGARRGTRLNARGVDLNRDFGRFRAPESRALAALIRRERPDVAIHFHQALDLVYRPRGATRTVVRAYARRVGMRVVASPPYRGTASSYVHRFVPRSTSFVVELPGGRPPPRVATRHARSVLAARGP
ncbi:MAG: DUF2817 domain-containing protein [Thermoleophilaceae bacterium]|nr:DUF2817 domain-containing protein [Thermoleophilaceae bacterium]